MFAFFSLSVSLLDHFCLFLSSLSFLSLSSSLFYVLSDTSYISILLSVFSFCLSFFRLLFVVLRVSAPRIHCFVFVPSYPSSLLLIKYYSNKNTSTSLPFPALPFTLLPAKPHRTPSFSYLSLHTLSHRLIYTFTHTHIHTHGYPSHWSEGRPPPPVHHCSRGKKQEEKQEARNNEQRSTSLKRYCFSPSIP